MNKLVTRLRVLSVAVGVLCFAILAAFAWETYRLTIDEAKQQVENAVDLLHEHALQYLETQQMILDQVTSLVADVPWQEIDRNPEIAARLRWLGNGRSEVAPIWLIDAKGEIRAASTRRPAGFNAAERDYFRALAAADIGTYVSKPYIGQLTGRPLFALARRRTTSDGSFDGVVVLAIATSQFTRFFNNVPPAQEHLAALIRADGILLAFEPTSAPLAPGDPLLEAMGASDRGMLWRRSRVDGMEHLLAFRKLDQYPVFVTFSVSKEALLEPWLNGLAAYGSIVAGAGVALILLMTFAVRRVRAEEAALVNLAAESKQLASVEAQLRQSQKLEALGQLTGGVAHDFNNLLTIVIGNLETLIRRPDDPKTPKRLRDALNAAMRGEKLVRSLLAVARRQPLTYRVFDLNLLIREMESLLRQALGAGIEVEFRFSSEVWPVETDESQTEMAILNLAVNARDAMPKGGRLSIDTANVRLAGECGGLVGDYVALKIADSGCGMPAAVLAHAFEPFFTTKEAGKGTGLGLATVYGFAKQSGGGATLESETGAGTAVTIYLPRSRASVGDVARAS